MAMPTASPASSMLTLFRPPGFLPHSFYSGSHTCHCPCISCKQLLQAATCSVNRFSNIYKECGFYILRLTFGLEKFQLHRGDKHDKWYRLKQYEQYTEDSMYLASTLHCRAEKWQPHEVEGHLSSCSSSIYTNVSEDEQSMRLTDQYFSALVGRRSFFSLASVCLEMLLTASVPSAWAVTAREQKLSSYDEKRLLEQNKRIQNANGAPPDFPNFIREGFNVKVVTPDKYVRCDSGLIYWDIKDGEGGYPKSGQQIVFHYTGFNESGRRIDSSYQQGRPAKTRMGINGLVPGIEEGIQTMKPGGKRRIIVPPELGPPVGPSTFFSAKQFEVFDVELLSVQDCKRRTFGFYSDFVCD